MEAKASAHDLLEQGAVECLLKPFSDTALREAINAALEKAKLRSTEELNETIQRA